MSTTCPPGTWKTIIEICDRRKAAKAREQDLIKARDATKSEIHELGADAKEQRTRAYMKRTADYYEAVEGIEACRRISKHLADQYEKAVDAGVQNKLFEIEDEDLSTPLPPAPLFEGDEDAPPVGGKTPEVPTSAPAAAPTGLDVAIQDIPSVSSAGVRELRDVGIITLSDFAKFMQDAGGDVKRLPKGVGKMDLAALEAKVMLASGRPADPDKPAKKGRGKKAKDAA